MLDSPNCSPKPFHKPLPPPLPTQSLPLQPTPFMKPLLRGIGPNPIPRTALFQHCEPPSNIYIPTNFHRASRARFQLHGDPHSFRQSSPLVSANVVHQISRPERSKGTDGR